ncbi:aldo/keto reductase [Azotosporobacter soli]|uniref:aldo/keto reductase family protein n=1 Tax=Azotosporobacter soli TaxID=3055040 RepID=UPI0031FEB847
MRRLNETFRLANGVAIPKLGFGTWLIEKEKQCLSSISYALKNGYRHIDTANDYGNEKNVGKAIKQSAVKREDLFITTKLSGDIKDVRQAEAAFKKSLKDLQLDYIDLYLIHSPVPWDECDDPQANYDKENAALWQRMEGWYREGLIRAIGVSNFSCADLTNLLEHGTTVPHVNQICYYIGCPQSEVVRLCKANQIQVIGHSPFAHGDLLHNEDVLRMAQKYDKSASQLCIAFALQNDILPLPKSTHEAYIIANTDVDFIIDDADMQYLSQLTNTIPDSEADYL